MSLSYKKYSTGTLVNSLSDQNDMNKNLIDLNKETNINKY